MSWEPLFTKKGERDEILKIIESIANDLSKHKSKEESLFGGNAGISIFWHYLYELQKNKAYKRLSSELLESSLTSIETTPQGYTFSTGLAGILWTASHLFERQSIPSDVENIIGEEVDIFLLSKMKADFHLGNCDYLHGASGMALYFLARKNSLKRNESLLEVLSGLEANAVELPSGIAWRDWFDKDTISYNLGLAHGVPSMVVVLSKLLEFNPELKGIRGLLEKSVEWVLSMRSESESTWLFPTTFPLGSSRGGRLSWCYGDLGVSIAIFQAGAITGKQQWMTEALEIALHASKKRDLNKSGVVDSCLCHGTAGNAHIFNRLYQHTGNIELKEASEYWYGQTLNLFKSSYGLRTWRLNEEMEGSKWIYQYGLLEGISGIGLTLISSISEIEPKWDRCLLLS